MARLGGHGRTRCGTCASTAARRSRSDGSSATGSCARTTAGITGRRRLHANPPARGPDARARQGARGRVRARERYGLIWVAHGRAALGRCPRSPSSARTTGSSSSAGPYAWNCDACRQLENFTDFGHFPWVHPGPARRSGASGGARPHASTIDDHVLRYDIVRPEAPNSDDFPVFGNEAIEAPERRSRYQLHLPYTILLRLGWGGQEGMVYFFASQPVDDDRCTGYVAIARNYDLEQPPQVLQDFEDTIFNQDRRVVESQRPERVPFDLAAEMHLKFDAVAINYRQAMRERAWRRAHPDERACASVGTAPRDRRAPSVLVATDLSDRVEAFVSQSVDDHVKVSGDNHIISAPRGWPECGRACAWRRQAQRIVDNGRGHHQIRGPMCSPLRGQWPMRAATQSHPASPLSSQPSRGDSLRTPAPSAYPGASRGGSSRHTLGREPASAVPGGPAVAAPTTRTISLKRRARSQVRRATPP